jgi:hypothetical protein
MLAQLGAEFEIDLGEMGFEFDAEESKEGLTDEDDVPEVPAEPVAKLGQMWKLGKITVYFVATRRIGSRWRG